MSVRKSKSPGVLVSGQSSGSPIPYTPVITWAGNTIGTVLASYVRIPGALIVWGQFQETAGTASAVVSIAIPAGFIQAGPGIASGVGTYANQVGATVGLVSSSVNTVTTGGTVVGVVATHSFNFIVPVIG